MTYRVQAHCATTTTHACLFDLAVSDGARKQERQSERPR
jgi:hypothetical protein